MVIKLRMVKTMKFLVLSCSTGEGHNSAAKAICEAAAAKGIECEFKDPVSFRGEKTPKRIAGLYNGLIKKTPRAFGAVYKLGGLYDDSKLPSPIYAWNASYADALNAYVIDGGFDAVLSTHLYGMEALTAIKRSGKQTVPFFGVMTDYTAIPFTRDTVLDGYFIPHSDLTRVFVARGIDAEKIYPTGIPVSPSIRERVDVAETRKILGLPADRKIILIMSGGVGCESVKPLVKKFKKGKFDDDNFYCVLVGNNEKLKKTVEKRCPTDGVVAKGFTNRVGDYLKCVNAVITKSGGLSSTEVAAANIPLVHFKPIPGCETCNAEFFKSKGLSLLASSATDAIKLANDLLNDETQRERMIKAQSEEINAFAADDIVGRVVECLSVNT